MAFEFQTPAIHSVVNVTALARTIDNRFACLTITFHGACEPQKMDAYFDQVNINRAHALAAVINALTPKLVEVEAA
jgi:hypothetical protein